MSKLKNILLDAEAALRTFQNDLLVDDVTVDELKYCVDDGSFYVLLAVTFDVGDDAVAKRLVVPKDYDRAIHIEASEYDLVMSATVSMIELTEFVPEILATLAEEA